MKTPEEMAEEYCADIDLCCGTSDIIIAAEKAFKAGYQAARDQVADVSKAMPQWNSVDTVGDLINRSAIQHTLAALEKKPAQQWISVTDRLPEINQQFIAFVENKEVCNCCRYQNRSSDNSPSFYASTKTGLLICGLESISHWMPLPEAPKEEK